MKRRAVFLDRDGVINRIVWRDGKPASPRHVAEFELFEDSEKAVRTLKNAGLAVFVVTNQPDISRGLMSHDALDDITKKLLQSLAVDDISICRHDDCDACECRKPKPGLLVSLACQWGIDLKSSFIIGDTAKDVGAGRAAGVAECLLIDTSYNAGVACDQRFACLGHAADYIAKHSSKGIV